MAVAVITIVTGSGPQLKVITPPAATAATTACDVQLAGVPLPITRSGCDVSAGAASGGSGTPPGLPGRGDESRSADEATVAGPSIRSTAAKAVAAPSTKQQPTTAAIVVPRLLTGSVSSIDRSPDCRVVRVDGRGLAADVIGED